MSIPLLLQNFQDITPTGDIVAHDFRRLDSGGSRSRDGRRHFGDRLGKIFQTCSEKIGSFRLPHYIEVAAYAIEQGVKRRSRR
jgi:hypothetical protein